MEIEKEKKTNKFIASNIGIEQTKNVGEPNKVHVLRNNLSTVGQGF